MTIQHFGHDLQNQQLFGLFKKMLKVTKEGRHFLCHTRKIRRQGKPFFASYEIVQCVNCLDFWRALRGWESKTDLFLDLQEIFSRWNGYASKIKIVRHTKVANSLSVWKMLLLSPISPKWSFKVLDTIFKANDGLKYRFLKDMWTITKQERYSLANNSRAGE